MAHCQCWRLPKPANQLMHHENAHRMRLRALSLHAVGQTAAQALAVNRSAWMVLSPSLVSQTGDDCDLVGTSFAAFRNQVVRSGRVRCCHVRAYQPRTHARPLRGAMH